jgi:hypothetical protein
VVCRWEFRRAREPHLMMLDSLVLGLLREITVSSGLLSFIGTKEPLRAPLRTPAGT